MKNQDKLVSNSFPVCVHRLKIRYLKDDLVLKTVNCSYYCTSQRVIGKFYKQISYKWSK